MSDDEVDQALGRLASADLPPFEARALGAAAERRFKGERRATRLERWEAPLLVALSAAHVLWAIGRVLL